MAESSGQKIRRQQTIYNPKQSMSCHMIVSLVYVSQPKNNNKHILNITNNATQDISYEKQRLVSERKVYASQ